MCNGGGGGGSGAQTTASVATANPFLYFLFHRRVRACVCIPLILQVYVWYGFCNPLRWPDCIRYMNRARDAHWAQTEWIDWNECVQVCVVCVRVFVCAVPWCANNISLKATPIRCISLDCCHNDDTQKIHIIYIKFYRTVGLIFICLYHIWKYPYIYIRT